VTANRPLALGFQRRYLKRPAEGLVGHPDPQLGIQHQQGLPNGFDDGHGEVARLREHRVLGLQLVVDRDQLFVGGLQLFLGGLQFLVEALQFLVGRKRLLGGVLAFFPDDCCSSITSREPLLGVGQLLFQPGDLAVPEIAFGRRTGGLVAIRRRRHCGKGSKRTRIDRLAGVQRHASRFRSPAAPVVHTLSRRAGSPRRPRLLDQLLDFEEQSSVGNQLHAD
jgi:hypothetical protein